ncbi:MAG: hypothetical protein QGI34_17035, partial [Candidatus Latescibacteria bacterium]|nr:hypothetical protein [Candidatus Latescibacterota bacterium]
RPEAEVPPFFGCGLSQNSLPRHCGGGVFACPPENRRRGLEDDPLTDLDTALESHRVVFAADRSASEGRSVKLNEFQADL